MDAEREGTCSVCLGLLRRTEAEFVCPDCGVRWAAEHVIDLGPWNVGGEA